MYQLSWRSFSAFTDAVQAALIDKFGVDPDTAEEWTGDYIEAMPDREVRTAVTVAHEIFMERAQ